jgi:hypothetical protein
MKRTSIRAVLLCLAVVAVLALAAAPVQAKRNVNPGVIPPHAKAFGGTYTDWSVKWWQWLVSTPVPDTPGAYGNAGEGQSGKVWFLAVCTADTELEPGRLELNQATWTVTMPAGRAVFFPIWAISGDRTGGQTVEEAEFWPDWFIDRVTRMAVTIDGRRLGKLFDYRFRAPWFTWTRVEGNLLGHEAWEPTDAIADGYYLLLAPLSVGRHVIHIDSQWDMTAADGYGEYTRIGDITYRITVTPR